MYFYICHGSGSDEATIQDAGNDGMNYNHYAPEYVPDLDHVLLFKVT